MTSTGCSEACLALSLRVELTIVSRALAAPVTVPNVLESYCTVPLQNHLILFPVQPVQGRLPRISI